MKVFKKLLKKKLWETLSFTFAALMTIMVVVNAAIVPFNNEIHGFLYTTDFKETKIAAKTGEEEVIIERPALKNEDNIEDYYRDVNEQVQAEGLVLLKNDNNALPLASDANVTFALSGSAKIFYASHGPGVRRDGEKDNAYWDLKRSLEDLNANEGTDLKINAETYNFLKSGAGMTARGVKNSILKTDEPSWSAYTGKTGVVDHYKNGTSVIAVITRQSGEGMDVSWTGSDGVDGSYISLTANELAILENLALLKDIGAVKNIIVLINSAVTIQCDFIFDAKYDIDAAMWIGLPGATGMKAVAKALVGKINPSGKLSDTFLKNNFSSPAAMDWKLSGGFSQKYTNSQEAQLNNSQMYYGVYVEGMYVGYRYYETRYEDYVLKTAGVGEYNYSDDVAYPFGYGLSYSTFNYSDFDVGEKVNNKYKVSVTVTNTGSVAGKEVAQIYLQKPYSDYSRKFGIEKPSVELVGFAKTGELAPGGSEELNIYVDFELFRSYDSTAAKTYILDKGKHFLTAAANAHDAVNNILAKKEGYTTLNSKMDTDGNAGLAKMVLNSQSVDTHIFSTSTAKSRTNPNNLSLDPVGTKIENQLDFMDPNRFNGVTNEATEDGDVVYVSRKNWHETLPKKANELILTENVDEKYDITSHKTIVEEKDAVMPKFNDLSSDITLAMMAGLEYNDPQWDTLLNRISQDDMFLVLTNCYGFTPALPSVAKPLTDEDDGPYGVSNTKEGYSSMSCEGIIASTFNIEIYDKVGEAIAADARSGHDAKQKHLHGLYASGLNMHRVAFGGRAAEYFSEDSFLSGIASMYEIIAMQKQGVVAHPKHFIFNDEEINRNGIGIWMNEQTAREIYLLPWEYSLRPDKGNAHALMTSFNRAGLLWTSANDNLMENILRGEWAFDGYTLTDMAGSNGKLFMVYDDGFMNGTDCFLDKGLINSLTSEMKNSPTFNAHLRESMHRLLFIVANYSASLDGYSNLTRIVSIFVWWKFLITALTVIFIVLAAVSVVMFVLSDIDKRKNIFKVKEKKLN